MTNQERRERRREAALKAAQTRKAKARDAEKEPEVPTSREILERARALGIHRERAIYRWAHELKAGQHPQRWPWMVRQALLGALEVWEGKRR
jgi:hypothetical protein